MGMRIFVLLLAGCSASGPSYVEGFNPPAAQSGYLRYVAPAIHKVMPGDDLNECQWLEQPADHDRLVVATGGYQSKGGHHCTLYATKLMEKNGTSRICTNDDMLNVSFLGAIGGEGNGSNVVKLPDGLAFTLTAGQALMANAHYINASLQVFDAQSVIDVKYSTPNEQLHPVGFIAVNWAGFNIPAQTSLYSSEARCTATQKLSFFMWGNHMHEYGVAELSELIRQDGTVVPLAMNDSWTRDKTFNTPWVTWDVASPLVVNAGDTFHLKCSWANMTDSAVGFPREMCVGSGFVLEGMPQSVCEAN
jgi:hypothetical protein